MYNGHEVFWMSEIDETVEPIVGKTHCRVSLDLLVELKESYQRHAKSYGETLSEFLRRAAKEQMMRDNQ